MSNNPLSELQEQAAADYRAMLRKFVDRNPTPTERQKLLQLSLALGFNMVDYPRPEEVSRNVPTHMKIMQSIITIEGNRLTVQAEQKMIDEADRLAGEVEKLRPEMEAMQRRFNAATSAADKAQRDLKLAKLKSEAVPRQLFGMKCDYPWLLTDQEAPFPQEMKTRTPEHMSGPVFSSTGQFGHPFTIVAGDPAEVETT